MYCIADTCFLCLKNNIKVQSVLIQDTDGIVVNEKLRCFFPDIIDSTPDAHKLSCLECLEKLRISYDFKQSVIRNNALFRDYIEKLQCQHKSRQELTHSKHRINLAKKTAKKVNNSHQKHDSNSLKIQNENPNLTSTNQVNTDDQSCQLNTNENVAIFTKFNCQPEDVNLETENVETVDPLMDIEKIYIKQEPFNDDNFTTNYLDENSKESEESTSTSIDDEYNTQPQQEGKQRRLHKCSECQKTFTRPSNLARHKRLHSGEKPHKCEICHRSFAQVVNLNTHKLTHTGERTHQCDICHKMFNLRGILLRHKRSHDDIKRYQCSVCRKTFAETYNLTKHMRIHTGETPYECHLCEFKCAQGSNLKRHIRSHTGEKPYECDICEFKSSNAVGLKRHIRSHTGDTPYHCSVCNKSFIGQLALTTHMLVHARDLPFECKHCKKSFLKSKYLNAHLRRLHS